VAGHGLARRRAGQATARRLRSRHRIRTSGGRRRGEFDQGERDREFLSDNADMRAVEPYVAVVTCPIPSADHPRRLLRTCGARHTGAAYRDAQKELSPRRHRLFAAIVVEAALRLTTEPAGLDIFHQQRTRAVLGVGQALVQHLHDERQVSSPMKSASSSGPIGWCAPSRMAVSIASTLPTPS